VGPDLRRDDEKGGGLNPSICLSVGLVIALLFVATAVLG
jgi:hypothetical protein